MNLTDIVILLMIGLLIVACIRSLANARKSGKPSCGAANCSGCGMSCTCALGKKDMKKVG